jgi:hypothetical protein
MCFAFAYSGLSEVFLLMAFPPKRIYSLLSTTNVFLVQTPFLEDGLLLKSVIGLVS